MDFYVNRKFRFSERGLTAIVLPTIAPKIIIPRNVEKAIILGGDWLDNFKIIYKILRELERNMGNENFSIHSITAEYLKIAYEKWEQLLIMMADKGYIKGIVVSKSLEDKFRHIAEPICPEITLEGLEYLASNGFMGKAKELLKMAGDIM